MSETDDVAYWLTRLALPDARARVEALKQIAAAPVADARLLRAAEALLDDREVCLVQIPYRFGEVRFYAADAVAALRSKAGNAEPVVVVDTFYPLTTDDVGKYAAAAGVEVGAGIDGVIATLRELVARGAVTTRTITR